MLSEEWEETVGNMRPASRLAFEDDYQADLIRLRAHDREQRAEIERLAAELSRLRDSARVRDARYIGVIEALLHGVDEYWEEHDGRETVLDAIRLVEESKP